MVLRRSKPRPCGHRPRWPSPPFSWRFPRWNVSRHAATFRAADAFVVSVQKSGRTWVRVFMAAYFAEWNRMGFPRRAPADLHARPLGTRDEGEARRPVARQMAHPARGRGAQTDPARRPRPARRDGVAVFPPAKAHAHLRRRFANAAASPGLRRAARGRHHEPLAPTSGNNPAICTSCATRTRARTRPGRSPERCAFSSCRSAELDAGRVGPRGGDRQLRQHAAAGSRRFRAPGAELVAGLKEEALRPCDAHDPDSYKVRRGKVGGYVDYLAPSDIGFSTANSNGWTPVTATAA